MDHYVTGTTIRQLREAHHLTQSQLADILGVTAKAVSKWERDLSCPDINSLPSLAEVLGVSVEELMQVEGISEKLAERILGEANK